jgi:hypothetical protein
MHEDGFPLSPAPKSQGYSKPSTHILKPWKVTPHCGTINKPASFRTRVASN